MGPVSREPATAPAAPGELAEGVRVGLRGVRVQGLIEGQAPIAHRQGQGLGGQFTHQGDKAGFIIIKGIFDAI